MADIVDRRTRSRMMAGIRSKDTKPEMIVRQGLFSKGLRFRLHDNRLPGKPDLVFPKYRAVVFVHGCFWHAHRCSFFKWPSTRTRFWKEKIGENRKRDRRALAGLKKAGWRVCLIWECALRTKSEKEIDALIFRCKKWLTGRKPLLELSG